MLASLGSTSSTMSTRLSAQVRARAAGPLKVRPRGTDNPFLPSRRPLEDAMEFLTFLGNYFRSLSLSDPKVLAGGVAMAIMALTRRWLLIFMILGTVVACRALEFYYPQADGPILADMSLIQVIYIVAGIIIVITFIGQLV